MKHDATDADYHSDYHLEELEPNRVHLRRGQLGAPQRFHEYVGRTAKQLSELVGQE